MDQICFKGLLIGFPFYTLALLLGSIYAFQIDTGVSVNFKDTPQIFNVGLGLSYRLNLNPIK